MTPQTMKSGYLVNFFSEGHVEILRQTDRLSRVLTHLRYEGRPYLGRNIKEAKEVLEFFEHPFVKHLELEEEVIYPFLETHVPKFAAVISLLRSEHVDIRNKLQHMKSLFRKISTGRQSSTRGNWIDEIEATGTYFIYLLRNHMQTESESVYKAIVRELGNDEIKRLERIIKKGEAELERTKRRHAP